MHEKLLLVFKDSQVLEVEANQDESFGEATCSDFKIKEILDFLHTWSSGSSRRFMVKEIPNRFRFGIGFVFVDGKGYSNETLLFILVRYLSYCLKWLLGLLELLSMFGD